MTITTEILQTIWDNNKSSGKEYIDVHTLKSILEKYDPQNYNSFQPNFG